MKKKLLLHWTEHVTLAIEVVITKGVCFQYLDDDYAEQAKHYVKCIGMMTYS
jgi:hypothetical protein